MKNTRTARSSNSQKDGGRYVWIGKFKFWKRFQLKTSRGDYK